MQLRRFTATTTPAALAAVREALGEHAIILANRRVGDQVEIIATGQMDEASSLAEVSVDNLTAELAQRLPNPVPAAAPSIDRVATDTTRDNTDKTNLAGPALADQSQSESFAHASAIEAAQVDGTTTIGELSKQREERNSPLSSMDPTNWTDRAILDSAATAINNNDHAQETANIDTSRQTSVDLLGLPPIAGPESDDTVTVGSGMRPVFGSADDGPTEPDTARPASGIDKVLHAFESQSNLINSHFKSLAVNLWGANSPNRSLLLQRLIGLGIGAELAVRLVERTDPGAPIDQSMRDCLALLKATLPIGVDKTLSQPGITVTFGPPGAGKTTVLIKLAAEHVKAQGSESVVLICADTRRIGAYEELQAYGRILGIPTVHAHDVGELDSLLSAFTHKQLVLIDHTLPGADDSIELPTRLLHASNPDLVRHLFVLNAGMQSSLADSLLARHTSVAGMQCVLTHLDTAARLGELFNPVIRHHMPVAYWSDSASVQQPLQKSDASVLVASAVAMRRRVEQSIDDKWLHRLIQPAQPLSSGAFNVNQGTGGKNR